MWSMLERGDGRVSTCLWNFSISVLALLFFAIVALDFSLQHCRPIG